MKTILIGLLTISSILVSTKVSARSKDKMAILALVQNYFDALNAGDASKATSYFSKNGELLPQGAPTATGTEQIGGTFKYVFDNFSYALKVSIENIEVQGSFAFASSSSKGTLTIKAKNETLPGAYRETFILKKVNGNWKIARYMYNQAQ